MPHAFSSIILHCIPAQAAILRGIEGGITIMGGVQKLTAVKVAKAGPGRHHDGAGTGLFLWVKQSGSRQWVQRLTVKGRRVEIGLGAPPIVSLAMAREQAVSNARLIRAGGDPLAEKRKASQSITFAEAVEQYLSSKLDGFRNEKHQKQWRATLATYASPVLGAMPVKDIGVADVLRVLNPIWKEKAETASRLRGRIENVLSWAAVAGHRQGDNPARWAGNLKELLAAPSRLAKGDNQPAIALADLPRWWKALQGREGMAAQALRFSVLTAARSGEVRGMAWGEVSLPEDGSDGPAVWTIPAARMKNGRQHTVPLCSEAVALLRSLPRNEGSGLVFFAPRGGELSDMTLSAVMRRMQEAETANGSVGFLDPVSKRPAVPHGLRSSFRQWAAEKGYARDMAEIQLAHFIGSEVERAYMRSDMVERRRAMMADWASFLAGRIVTSTPSVGGGA
jgi:integrase